MILYDMILYDLISYDMISYDMIAAADAAVETCETNGKPCFFNKNVPGKLHFIIMNN